MRQKVHIGRLNIRLPRGFECRADAVARETVRQLARLPVTSGASLAGFEAPKVSVRGGESNGVIARRIARSLHEGIRAAGCKGR